MMMGIMLENYITICIKMWIILGFYVAFYIKEVYYRTERVLSQK